MTELGSEDAISNEGMQIERSWLPSEAGSGFPITSLPYGIAQLDAGPSVVAAIGAFALDLKSCAEANLLDIPGLNLACLSCHRLNELFSHEKPVLLLLRAKIQQLLSQEKWRSTVEPYLIVQKELHLLCPVEPGDFVDFYASYHHASRSMAAAGVADPEPSESWHAMPLGYHSRTGSIVGDGARVRRPWGQVNTRSGVKLSKTRSLDFELEVGFVLCGPKEPDQALSVDDFSEKVFGLVLLNDWSARDSQSWESEGLGPSLSKSFATQMGSWVVPLEALDAVRCRTPVQKSSLRYLQHEKAWGFDIELTAAIQTSTMVHNEEEPAVITETNFKYMHWSGAQLFAHMTVNGVEPRPGDLIGSGTVSGPEQRSAGCLLELSNAGCVPITLPNGELRRWVEDGDRVVIEGATVSLNGEIISLGKVCGEVLQVQS